MYILDETIDESTERDLEAGSVVDRFYNTRSSAYLEKEAERFARSARVRGLRQKAEIAIHPSEGVLQLQWYRETPGDLVNTVDAPPPLRLTGERLP